MDIGLILNVPLAQTVLHKRACPSDRRISAYALECPYILRRQWVSREAQRECVFNRMILPSHFSAVYHAWQNPETNLYGHFFEGGCMPNLCTVCNQSDIRGLGPSNHECQGVKVREISDRVMQYFETFGRIERSQIPTSRTVKETVDTITEFQVRKAPLA